MNIDKERITARIILYLNQKAGKRFKPTSKTNYKPILEQLNKGYEVSDFKEVIDLKVIQWLHVPSMKPYLKPSTLFAKHNFQNYLKEVNCHD